MNYMRNKAESLNSQNRALRDALQKAERRADFYWTLSLAGWGVTVITLIFGSLAAWFGL